MPILLNSKHCVSNIELNQITLLRKILTVSCGNYTS